MKFLGSLSDEDLARLYRSSDIFVFPCERQSWGLAPLEAMLFETPVIISSEVGVSEVLRGKNVGILVPPRDPQKLAEAIRLLVIKRNLREEMGRSKKICKNHLTYV